jgi:hypothetical protein
MAQISGGKVWWMPIGSEDLVRVTDDVMSYEPDGELRLSESIGTLDSIGLTEETAEELALPLGEQTNPEGDALALPYAGHPDYCEEWRP